MSNNIRKITRASFHVAKLPLKVLDYLSARLYMKCYLKILENLGVKIEGIPRYISPGCKIDDFEKITIGDNVVISDRVVLLTHDYSLTTGLRKIGSSPDADVAFIKPIKLGSNVFVGMGAVILPGSNIGNDVIVGAGSVVRGKIPDNSIVLGNPAVIVGALDEKATRWKDAMSDADIRAD